MASSAGDVPFVYRAQSMCQGLELWDSNFIEQASRRFPKNEYFPWILGLGLAEENRYSEAVEQLQEAELRAAQCCEDSPNSLVPISRLKVIQTDLRDARELVRRHLPN